MLVSQNGKVIKANKKAMALFKISQSESVDVKRILGMEFKELRAMQPDIPIKKLVDVNGEKHVFEVTASGINQGTVYVSLVDASDNELVNGISDSIAGTGKAVALSLSQDFCVIGGFGRLGKWDSIDSMNIKSLKLGNMIPASDYASLEASLKSKGRAMIKTDVSIGGYKEKAYMSVSKTAFGYMCIMLSWLSIYTFFVLAT